MNIEKNICITHSHLVRTREISEVGPDTRGTPYWDHRRLSSRLSHCGKAIDEKELVAMQVRSSALDIQDSSFTFTNTNTGSHEVSSQAVDV